MREDNSKCDIEQDLEDLRADIDKLSQDLSFIIKKKYAGYQNYA